MCVCVCVCVCVQCMGVYGGVFRWSSSMDVCVGVLRECACMIRVTAQCTLASFCA